MIRYCTNNNERIISWPKITMNQNSIRTKNKIMVRLPPPLKVVIYCIEDIFSRTIYSHKIYQDIKFESLSFVGLLWHFLILGQIWEVLTIYFIERLLKLEAYNLEMMVVEKLHKHYYFLVLKHPITIKKPIKIFM